MTDISIIEFGVYGLIAYSSLLMLIISTIKNETATTKAQSIVRSMYMMPGIICASILSTAGVNITFNDYVRANIINDTSAQIFTEIETVNNQITLLEPVWVLVHVMIFLVLLVYVITQMLNLFTKIE